MVAVGSYFALIVAAVVAAVFVDVDVRDGPKMALRWHRNVPKMAQAGPKMVSGCQGCLGAILGSARSKGHQD